MKQPIKNEQSEKDLFDALSYVNIAKLPAKHDGRSKKIWTKAIIECVKSNGSVTYVVGEPKEDNGIKIKKTFGESAQVMMPKEHTTIYPYEFLDASNVPAKEDAEKFLEKYSGVEKEELEEMPAEEKESLLKYTAVKVQNANK